MKDMFLLWFCVNLATIDFDFFCPRPRTSRLTWSTATHPRRSITHRLHLLKRSKALWAGFRRSSSYFWSICIHPKAVFDTFDFFQHFHQNDFDMYSAFAFVVRPVPELCTTKQTKSMSSIFSGWSCLLRRRTTTCCDHFELKDRRLWLAQAGLQRAFRRKRVPPRSQRCRLCEWRDILCRTSAAMKVVSLIGQMYSKLYLTLSI